MKQYIKFLKFLWVILIVPSLYGMENLAPNNNKRPYSLSEVQKEDQKASSKKAKTDSDSSALRYGLVTESLDDCPDLINVVKQTLKVDVSTKEEAKGFVKSVLRTFGEHMGPSMNFLLWDGQIYLNGLIPISDFDSLKMEEVREGPYPILQLCDILEYKDKEIKKKLEAAGKIADCFSLLNESLYWNPVNAFFDEAKVKKNSQMNSLLDKHLQENAKRMEAVAEYIKALRSLKISTVKLKFNRNGLLNSLNDTENETRDLLKGYLEAFGNYISFLDPDDGKSFLDELISINALPKRKGYLIKAHKLWTKKKYNRYTHTECIVEYLWKKQKEKGIQPTPLNMISFRDVCKYCKKMFAKIPPEYYITVISGKQYLKYDPNCRFCNQRRKRSDGNGEYNAVIDPECNNCEDSRAKEHSNDQNNSNLSQIQLSPDFYLTN